MGRIRKLPEHLIRLIAAGEVVERPASVVKELVENSLDAGATQVSIDLWGAGRTRIRIADNGHGMSREDAETAFEHHATSKLQNFDDLYALSTFGFRGEALPSIASVSKLTLTTRSATESSGWTLTLDGGKLVSINAAGVPIGTTIDVQDLFFNTPARLKFLKRDSTERTHVLRTVEEMSMAHPGVRFDVSVDGKGVLLLPGTTHLGGRLADLWGNSVVEQLLPVHADTSPCRIRGMVNSVPAHHPTKAYQVLFVNQRPVQQRQLTYAVYEAYREWLPVGRHPIFALFIDIDPKLVDVNVHPTKREVRFSDERAVFDLIYRTIRQLFKETAPEALQDSGGARSYWPSSGVSAAERTAAIHAQAPATVTEPFSISDSLPLPFMTRTHEASPIHTSDLSTDGLRFLGQLQHVYLLWEQGDTFIVVDQHAAAERVLYERLLKQVARQDVPRQALLTPILWDVPTSRAEILSSYHAEFERLGFGLEPFGGNTFALKEWPVVLPDSRRAKRFLDEVIDGLANERPTETSKIHHEIAARAACRAAIMAGDPVSALEAEALMKDLAQVERPMTCPHGRPTLIQWSKEQLDKQFRRI